MSTGEFIYLARPLRVWFGAGALRHLGDEIAAIGGGSTIGLGKAVVWRNDAPYLVVATTYAGSEVTDGLGETEARLKTARRDPLIRPEAVIADPELTLGLPVAMRVAGGLNAIARAVDGLYANLREVTRGGILALLEAADLTRADLT